jgi:hypothetical protein
MQSEQCSNLGCYIASLSIQDSNFRGDTQNEAGYIRLNTRAVRFRWGILVSEAVW